MHRRYPKDPTYYWALGRLRLIQGDHSPQTWRLVYGKRDGQPFITDPAVTKAKLPLWDGTPIPGKRLLVWSWQLGHGDRIQWLRMMPAAKRQSQADVTLGVPVGTARMFASLQGVDHVIEGPGSSVSDYDVALPFMWLPVVCELTREVQYGVPYLQAEPDAVARWQPTFADTRLVHIGLHWIAQAGHGNAKWRSLTLEDLQPLFRIPGVRWYSLQQGADVSGYPITDLSGIDTPDARFVETMGVIENLDAVVCGDSSIAHLAGALAKPVELCLWPIYDVQWGAYSERQAPLYPHTTCWRPMYAPPETGADGQTAMWQAVIEPLAEELAYGFVEETLARRGVRV